MNNCILCKIINKDIPSKILYEDEKIMCIMDINPISDGHCIIFPKEHSDFFSETSYENIKHVMNKSKDLSTLINKSELGNNGINFLINEKENAGQEILHFHMHIIPKYNSKEGFITNNVSKNKKTIDENFNLILKSSIIL